MTVAGPKLLVGVLACSLALNSATAQNRSPATSGPLTSFADSLRARGIEISKPSLIAALHNSDPEIRSIAALKLAEDHDTDAVQSIEDALSIEKVPGARIGIASALWSLQDPKGLAHLQGMCSDVSLPIKVIVDVVRSLSVMTESSASCAEPILGYLDSHNNSESRLSVLWVLSAMHRWVPQNQAARMEEMLQNMLGDRDPSVRMEASHALAKISSPSSIGAVRNAVLREEDPGVRSSLQRDLNILQKKP